MPLLVPGRTCWKVARASRLSLIQDAAPCFSYMADAFQRARRSIFILGWDLDSRTVLRPDAIAPADRVLLPLLLGRLASEPGLRVFILTWDFSFVYAFEREPAPRRQFAAAHPRLHFALDGDHGSGGSHHQKVVVVDDEVAFVGGIDLTFHRWDHPEHPLVDGRRVDVEGHAYGPFHDVHTAVSGHAAAALGELARDRWNARRRPHPPPLAPAPSSPSETAESVWPSSLAVDARDIDVGIARTMTRPGLPTTDVGGVSSSIREIEALTVLAIATARRHIYAENQYLTSRTITRALGERLAAVDGPDVVLLLPHRESGWMEQSSMGLLRDEALAYLHAKDTHGRLRVLAPAVFDGDQAVPVAVHSKVLVIDDTFVKIGSANFSNRSMGLDSECDLAIEAPSHADAEVDGASGGDRSDGPAAAFVASVRNRLLGEHLGLDPQTVAARLVEQGSLRGLVDRPRTAGARRGLMSLPPASDAPADLTVFDGAMVDPPEPWNADMLLKRAFPRPLRNRLARRWMRPLGLAAIVLLGWTALRHFDPGAVQVRRLISTGTGWIADQPGGPVLAALAIALAGILFMPFTILATTALTVFGMWPGVAVAWAGAVLSALGSHAVGQRLGPRAVSWLPDRSLNGLRNFLGRRGFWAVVVIRLLPVGNFGVLNLLTGAVGVPRRAFLLGNMVGLLPGLLGLGLFVDRAIEAVRHPTGANVAVAVAIVALGTALGVVLKRRVERAAGVEARR